ncbi:signal peptidase I [Cellulomonas sp. DKR-3]|uniref:Signal peptidase I n=1 Tax=Cellulomonas fulva TaxID=2835530 RepID=A0ABS5U2V8_9CELL|nr:signal peptidase I [Cellulomonas fulva]
MASRADGAATAPSTPAEPTEPSPGPQVDPAEPDVSATRAGRREPRRGGTATSLLKETAIILVSALVLSWLIKTFLVQAFFIPSASMHDTLIEDDRIMVSKLTPGPFDLERGDIVVFKDPGNWLTEETVPDPTAWHRAVNDVLTFVGLYPQDAGEHLVKRVIGLPGDRVACAGAGEPITVNGVELDEPYLAAGAIPSQMAFDITVPADSLWVMGDNRQQSSDSRFHQGEPGGGSIPIDNVVGKAFVTVWPLDRATVLHNPGETFEDVPDPS